MNKEQFKQALLDCINNEESVHELRWILSGSQEFENLISDVNDDIERTERVLDFVSITGNALPTDI